MDFPSIHYPLITSEALPSWPMIYFIKRIIYKLLPEHIYLMTLHRGFYLLYGLGLLRKDPQYKYHYLVRELIEPDFSVVDIGANLGYFSKTFARLTPNGKVMSIEPVKPFFKVLQYFLKGFDHVTLKNCALGRKNGTATMVMPSTHGILRTGLPHIAASEAEKSMHRTHQVELVSARELLASLDRVDYIKCDIEGFEHVVFEEIRPILVQHRPMVQVEIAEANLETMLKLFNELGYEQYGVADFIVIREKGPQKEPGDYLFVHHSKVEHFENKLKGLHLLDGETQSTRQTV